jgi:hypothetical protein
MNPLDIAASLHHDVLLLIGAGPKTAKLAAMASSAQHAALLQLATLFGTVDQLQLLEELPASRGGKSMLLLLGAIVSFNMADTNAGQRAKMAFKAFCDTQMAETAQGSASDGSGDAADSSAEAVASGQALFRLGGWQAAWIGEAHSAAVLQGLGLRYQPSASSTLAAGAPLTAASSSSSIAPDDALVCLVFYVTGSGDELLRAVAAVPRAKEAVVATLALPGRVWVRCVSDDAALHVADHVKKSGSGQHPKANFALASAFPKS